MVSVVALQGVAMYLPGGLAVHCTGLSNSAQNELFGHAVTAVLPGGHSTPRGHAICVAASGHTHPLRHGLAYTDFGAQYWPGEHATGMFEPAAHV